MQGTVDISLVTGSLRRRIVSRRLSYTKSARKANRKDLDFLSLLLCRWRPPKESASVPPFTCRPIGMSGRLPSIPGAGNFASPFRANIARISTLAVAGSYRQDRGGVSRSDLAETIGRYAIAFDPMEEATRIPCAPRPLLLSAALSQCPGKHGRRRIRPHAPARHRSRRSGVRCRCRRASSWSRRI
jgi:hypothetical protein